MQITLKQISKSFGERMVLTDVSLAEEITSLAVIGPSGAGKSTLLRIIGGLLVPSAGELLIDGKKINFTEKELLAYRRTIGFVFQSKGLFEHLTALENVTLPLIHAFGMNETDASRVATRLFARFGLEAEGHKYPPQLSGGQQQRIQICRAVAGSPRLLLLDEPTSALDPELTAEVLDMLGELQKTGLNTIIVTHEMGFAKRACEKVIFVADGRIVESGKSSELFAAPRTEQLQAFLDKVLEWHV
ncbi:MAG TPA: amino acid ABC transporter ATP-binding protein [Firmicutes bacterium]|nr:amino acid ABC transporter ATP-binding protein [Bacillota bacterium]